MKLSNITIVLVRPINSGNVGSVVRAMKNTGVKKLVLIDPCDFNNNEAKKMAIGDKTILTKAKVSSDLCEVLKPFHWTVATTRRSRRRFNQMWTPRQVAEKIFSMSNQTKIALVFGPEDKGLKNDELALCQNMSHIDSHPGFPSLNLAQAVMIYLYEIYFKSLKDNHSKGENLASVSELEAMYDHFRIMLTQVGFFNRGKPETLMESIRNFLSRSAMSPRDVRILRGIFTTVQRRLRLLQ